MQRTVQELCLAPGESLPNPLDDRETPTPLQPVAGPSRLSSQSLSEYIVIDDDDEEDEISRHVAEPSAAGPSNVIPPQPVDPLVNRTVGEIAKDKHDFGLSRFAISEKILADRADVDELLSMLSLDELKVRRPLSRQQAHTEGDSQALGKELRVSNKATTRSALMQAIKLNASSQSTLTSMFAAGAAKAEAKKAALRARKGKGRASDISDGTRSPPATSQTQLVISKSTTNLSR